MKWTKKGLIIKPTGNLDWMVTHASVPFAECIGGDIYRIYFSGRDSRNRSLIGYAEIDINEPGKVLYITKEPVLGLGVLGCFDDNGVTPSWIVNHGGKKYLYYIGWNAGATVRMSLIAGLAVSRDGGKTFTRVSLGPLLERTDTEPYSILTAPCVLLEDGVWRMWYVCGTGWEVTQNDFMPKHYYHIRYAESLDGLAWNTEETVCIDFEGREYAIARPVVYKEGGTYKMWYCRRGGWNTYRAGYAESDDGLSWKRLDDITGIDVSQGGWDSEMICYPFVFTHEGQTYMLYNGNGYGRTGCGYAVLDE